MLESRSTSNSGVIHIDIPNIRQILKIAFSVTVPVVLLLLPTILFQLISWRCWSRRKKNTPSKPSKMTNTHKTPPKRKEKDIWSRATVNLQSLQLNSRTPKMFNKMFWCFWLQSLSCGAALVSINTPISKLLQKFTQKYIFEERFVKYKIILCVNNEKSTRIIGYKPFCLCVCVNPI